LIAVLLILITGLPAISVAAFRANQTNALLRDITASSLLASQSLGDTNATISQIQSIVAGSIYHSAQARYAMLNAAANPQVATFTASADGFQSMAFSPDGKTLLTAGGADTAGLWNVAGGREIGSPIVGNNTQLESAVFNWTEKRLAVVSNAGSVAAYRGSLEVFQVFRR